MYDFSKYLFRASQVSHICVGAIGLSTNQENRIIELQNEKEKGINVNGNKVKWTDNKANELTKLLDEQKNPSLPKTLLTEVKKIYRSEIYSRNFSFTNKYVQKGLKQEEDAITLYQMYLKANGVNAFFVKNEERLKNEYITGMPDINPIIIDGIKVGFDTKCSWELDTFPFKDEPLIDNYEYQNQCYMWLTGSEQWKTVYCLVNIHESGLQNEKLKYWYAMDCPRDYEDKNYESYIEKCKELERRLIFDYDRFVLHFPMHDLETSREEWMESVNPLTGRKGYDIPLNERVIEKTSFYDQNKIDFIKERIDLCRKKLSELK